MATGMAQQQKRSAAAIALESVRQFSAESGRGVEVSACFAAHLGHLSIAGLPDPAHEPWRRIAHLLRAPADRSVPERLILATRSWPQMRVDELIDLVRELGAVLETTENDRLEDEIRDSIRHHYL